MKIIRPLQISFNHQVIEQNRRFYFTASATLGVNLQTGEELLDLNYLKDVFESMGENPLPDMGMPKPNGEFLVSGSFFAPGKNPTQAGEVKIRVGDLEKQLFIFGPRKWQAGVPSNPENITIMPLDYAKAFGGEDFEKNPDGIGFNDGLLPCIENPKHLVASKEDKPDPAGLSPLYPALPQRMQFQGTYGSDYKERYFPGYPEDHDWKYFMCSPIDQWNNVFFKGDEPFSLVNLHPEIPKIEGRLPGFIARCFINSIKDNQEIFSELPLNLDTIWFFPERVLALLIFRGVQEVEDDEALTISDIICAYEDQLQQRRSLDYYHKAFQKRKNSDDGLLMNLNTQDLIPDNHKSAMELLMEMGLEGSEDEQSALLNNMDSKAEAIKKDADDQIKQAVQGIQNRINNNDFPKEGKIDIQKMIKEPHNTKTDPDLEEMKEKLESILPGVTADDPKKLDLKNFSFDKIDQLTEIVSEFSVKKEKAAKESAKKEIEKIKSQIEKKIEEIDTQIKNVKNPDSFEGSDLVKSLKNQKQQIKESLKPFEDIDLDEPSKTKAPLPRIDIDKIKEQTGQVNFQIAGAMQHLQSMKAMGLDGEKAEETEKQLQELVDNHFMQVEKKLQDAEKGFKEGYIMGAHFMDEGLSPHKNSLEEVKQQFLDSVSRGEDVSGKDWACIDLSGENLDGIDLRESYLEQVNFKGASLKGANLSEAILARANFEAADFSGAIFEKANIGAVNALRANFTGANLKSAKLSKGDFTQANFTGANLEDIETLEIVIVQADFTKARLPRVNFIETEITGVKFVNTDIPTAGFIKCVVINSDFSSSLMNACSFVNCKINDTLFKETDLTKACFVATEPENASMRYLDFTKACLNQANFQNMDLQNSIFTCADMENAYFGSANLSGADLSHARAKNAQFRKAILTRAKLDKINLDQGSLAKANLVGASFSGANLHAVDFLRSTITNTDFSGSNLDTTLIEKWRPE